jgi:GTP-binding protein
MPQSEGLPTVVIVGRPNVGKSTLFNAILGQRRSIVGDEPGITRDRIQGVANHRGRRFDLIDTGGIVVNDAEMIPSEILRQARFALENANQIIFLIDGRTEITGSDRDLVKMLQKLGKPVTLAVNKIDVQKREILTHEFYSLGIGEPYAISAEHRMGIEDLLDHVARDFPRDVPREEGEEAEPEELRPIKVAIIGRPNVGKSTLLNTLVGSERAIVSPIAGTTRDSVDETVEREGRQFQFVDTAGIRRKGKTHLMAEKMSVVMARRNIRMANVVVLVIEASEGIVGLDATIAGYAHEEGRGLIICVNKWDISKETSKKKFTEAIRDEFKFLDYAPVVFASAKLGTGVEHLFPLIKTVFENASKRISTGELNRFMETLTFEPEIKVKFITQPSMRPPTFILFTDKKRELHFSTERFLINRIRERFGFEGTPIVVKVKPGGRRGA